MEEACGSQASTKRAGWDWIGNIDSNTCARRRQAQSMQVGEAGFAHEAKMRLGWAATACVGNWVEMVGEGLELDCTGCSSHTGQRIDKLSVCCPRRQAMDM